MFCFIPAAAAIAAIASTAFIAGSPTAHNGQSEPALRFAIYGGGLSGSSAASSPSGRGSSLDSVSPRSSFIIATGEPANGSNLAESARQPASTSNLTEYALPGARDMILGPLGKEPFTLPSGKTYQSFDKAGLHFVLLDSTIVGQAEGHLDAAELKWLDSDLKRLKKETPVVIAIHHPIGGREASVDNEEALLRAISPFNILAIFSGSTSSERRWKVNGMDCVNVVNGSYAIVDFSAEGLTIRTGQTATAAVSAPVSVTVPRERPGGWAKQIAFLWDDPNLPLLARRRPLAELRVGKSGAHDDRVRADYALNGGTREPMERDDRDTKSVSFRAQFNTKGLPFGSNLLRLLLTDPSGDVYRRDEPFIFEQLDGAPKRAWDDPFRCDEGVQAGPVLADQTLFVTSTDGKLYAIDPKNGKRRWAAATKGPICAKPVLDGETVYAASSDHGLYAFESKSGRQKWRYDAGTPLFSSLGFAGGIIAVSAGDRLAGVGLDGKERWSRPLGAIGHSDVVASEDTVYLVSSAATLVAVDAASGEVRWKAHLGVAGARTDSTNAAPAVGGGLVYVSMSDGAIRAFDGKTGKPLWTAKPVDLPAGARFGTPAFDNGFVYAYGLDSAGECIAVNASDGSINWVRPAGLPGSGQPPAVFGNRLAVCSVTGRITWLDSKSGATMFRYALEPGFCFSTPAGNARQVYVTSMNGQVEAISVPR